MSLIPSGFVSDRAAYPVLMKILVPRREEVMLVIELQSLVYLALGKVRCDQDLSDGILVRDRDNVGG